MDSVVSDPVAAESPKGRRYVFVFSHQHLGFRVAELESICALFGISLTPVSDLAKAHVCIVEVESDADVARILSRSILLRSAYELFEEADDYDQLYKRIGEAKDRFERFNEPSQSFAFRVRRNGRKADGSYISQRVGELGKVLPLDKSIVDLGNALNSFTLVEEFLHSKAKEAHKIYFGRLIGHGQGTLKATYNLQDRMYIGNTTMDPELAFIQANIVKAGPGSLVLDPFCGTGGLVLPCAHFASAVFGTEINYMVAKAVGKSSRQGVKYLTENESLRANFDQYGTSHFFQSLLIADASQHEIWHSSRTSSGIFDALIADPPYGVREKSRKVGHKERKEHWTLPSGEHEQRFPEKSKYDLCEVFLDLLNLAARVLVVGGRIAYWFPVFPEDRCG
ncbi:hypothetical protein L596_014888 [Steinernema carpocapsae]|uniref:tRNA (guanine(10)-N(2))-methyltransferase TRMT11 n=1 Tax=Steinernema carpocapsae TaxID=34508 RepID=A0A4U5ND71_STECR|nr:hypothetical protein L596_014888 [Steinernema carpocapsae]